MPKGLVKTPSENAPKMPYSQRGTDTKVYGGEPGMDKQSDKSMPEVTYEKVPKK